MLMEQRLGLKLTQKTVLTQSLRQLVKLLALNKLELKEEIIQELEENPVLEIVGEGPGEAEAAVEDPWAEGERTSEPADREVTEAAAGPADGTESAPNDPFDEIDFGAYFEEYLDPGYRSPTAEVIEKPSFETFLSKPTSLTDHLLWQLSLSRADDATVEAAEAVIGNLNDDGYLTASVEEIASAAGVSTESVESALALVQEFDPLGVAARDVRECVTIQLRSCNADKGVAGQIVSEHWDVLERGDLAALAKALNRPAHHVEIAVALIRNLDPLPGQRYSVDGNRVVEPDVFFIKTPDGFRVVLNEDDLPDLRLNRQYRKLLKRGAESKEVRGYVRDRYNSAIQLIRNIEQRRQTIRSVCDSIVERQPGFLTHGVEQLVPMMIKEVAEQIGVHPSTVSRAVANKYAHTPHGVYELRFFFSEAGQGRNGSSIPLILLKRKVKKIIDEEDSAKPLTDDKISELLQQMGIDVTRRTVAKYREDLNIPSTHKRRRK
jgi:RNA polymerase sigma-54 factor